MRQLLFTTRRDVMAYGADGPVGADALGSIDPELILIDSFPQAPRGRRITSMRRKAARYCPDKEP